GPPPARLPPVPLKAVDNILEVLDRRSLASPDLPRPLALRPSSRSFSLRPADRRAGPSLCPGRDCPKAPEGLAPFLSGHSEPPARRRPGPPPARYSPDRKSQPARRRP